MRPRAEALAYRLAQRAAGAQKVRLRGLCAHHRRVLRQRDGLRGNGVRAFLHERARRGGRFLLQRRREQDADAASERAERRAQRAAVLPRHQRSRVRRRGPGALSLLRRAGRPRRRRAALLGRHVPGARGGRGVRVQAAGRPAKGAALEGPELSFYLRQPHSGILYDSLLFSGIAPLHMSDPCLKQEDNIEDYSVCSALCVSTSCKRDANKNLVPVRQPKVNFLPPKAPVTQQVLAETKRCLYCKKPGCQAACPSSLNVKQMAHATSVEDYYFAGKIAFSANPLALSCSQLCECEEGMCMSGCVLGKMGRPLKIDMIQRFAASEFVKLGIKQIPMYRSNGKKVAVIGAGPGGLSSATFLARLGFAVDVFEKEAFAGGLLVSQISQHRLAREDVDAEVKFVRDLGVQFHFNSQIGAAEIETLKGAYDAVINAVGRQAPIPLPFVPKETENIQFIQSSEFLRRANDCFKLKSTQQQFDLTGKRVLVLGGGNTAVDCAEVAQKLNATKVSLCFRKEVADLRASAQNINGVVNTAINVLPLIEACGNDEQSVHFRRNEKIGGKYCETEDIIKIHCDLVIIAYGMRKCPLCKINGVLNVGDAADSVTVVEAVNDGKIAAQLVYKQLINEDLEIMPGFCSEVDQVSLDVKLAGQRIPNPFLLAPSPLTANYDVCKAGLSAGFGGLVTLCDHVETLQKLAEEFPDRALFVGFENVMENLQSRIEAVRNCKISGIVLILQNDVTPDQLSALIFETKEHLGEKTPIFIKLNPDFDSLADYITVCKAFSVPINFSGSYNAVTRILQNGQPVVNFVTGAHAKPAALTNITKIKKIDQAIEVLGAGGIDSADSALSFLLAGANAVEMCSAVKTLSLEVIDEMRAGLQWLIYCRSNPRGRAYLQQQSGCPKGQWWTLSTERDQPVQTIEQICGEVVEKLKHSETKKVQGPRRRAHVEQDVCIGCGTCTGGCKLHAISIQENGKALVDENICVGCMLCKAVCTVDAIRPINV